MDVAAEALVMVLLKRKFKKHDLKKACTKALKRSPAQQADDIEEMCLDANREVETALDRVVGKYGHGPYSSH